MFIHALDTVGRTAACIDLEMLHPRTDLSRFSFRLAGERLEVLDGRRVVAIVDRATFAVSEPWQKVYRAVLAALGWD